VEAVILFPAIDLKNGEAVRLQQGDMARTTVFHRDPAEQARSFAAQGFEYLHIVDLDGAFAGRPINAAAVERILAAVRIPLQLGGGIRDRATIEGWLGKGVARVIIGTAAVRDPALVKEAAASPSGSMPATAKSPSRVGPRPPSFRCSISGGGSRTPVLPR
jgi:phosphoribosylformimino-5-aminoimidazole carboxamide ribotide isomerase